LTGRALQVHANVGTDTTDTGAKHVSAIIDSTVHPGATSGADLLADLLQSPRLTSVVDIGASPIEDIPDLTDFLHQSDC